MLSLTQILVLVGLLSWAPPTQSPPVSPATDDAAPATEPNAEAAKAPSPQSKFVPKHEPAIMAERKFGPGGNYSFKPGAGVTLATPDGDYSLNLTGYGQFLYEYDHHDPRPVDIPADSQSLQVRRIRLIIQGNVVSPHLKYHLQLQLAPREMGLGANGTIKQSAVFMWHVTYDRVRDVNIQAGYFFAPFSRQRYTAPGKLFFIDNSIAAYEFGFDRDTGVVLKSNDLGGLGKRLRYQAGVFMGDGYDFQFQRDFGMQYIGRVEVLPFGDFVDTQESDFARELKPKMAISGAYSFVDNDPRNHPLGPAPTDGGTTDTHNVSADLLFRVGGFSLFGDFFWRKGTRKPGNVQVDDGMGGTTPAPIERPRNGLGWTTQASMLIPRTSFEFGARYSGIRAQGPNTSLTNIDEVGPAFAYYFAQHAVKLQLDYFHQFGPLGTSQDRVRLQLVLGF
jgi:phosphate-selective porin OprO/OprP